MSKQNKNKDKNNNQSKSKNNQNGRKQENTDGLFPQDRQNQEAQNKK